MYPYIIGHKKGGVKPPVSFGFFYSLLLGTNVVFGFQNPVSLILISKDFDLV